MISTPKGMERKVATTYYYQRRPQLMQNNCLYPILLGKPVSIYYGQKHFQTINSANASASYVEKHSFSWLFFSFRQSSIVDKWCFNSHNLLGSGSDRLGYPWSPRSSKAWISFCPYPHIRLLLTVGNDNNHPIKCDIISRFTLPVIQKTKRPSPS